MKKAVGYIRISKKDQSNFSTEAQQRHIQEYAGKHDIEIASFFIDDGKSAKNFDRPDWKKLEEFIKVHYKSIDYLVVVKYDRFSRNTSEGLAKIEMLERKYRIIIISVFEQMFIDYDSPFFFKQRADMLVNAEFELHVIRDRTKFGINQALNEGRFVNKAPYGYKNIRDGKKPLIVIDEKKAFIVRKIYEDFLSGVPEMEIYRQALAEGFTKRGHSSIARILKNPVYGGLVYVPAYRKDVPKIQKAVHQGIVSEAVWWQCQGKLGSFKQRTTLNEHVPLRGLVNCSHGVPLTAGESRGKCGGKYWYYMFNHCRFSVSAKVMHNKLDEIWKHMSLPDEYIGYLEKESANQLDVSLKDRNKNLRSYKLELEKLEENITRLEEKFITEQINHDTYAKWSKVYHTEIEVLRHKVSELESGYIDHWNLFHSQLYKLADIHYLYHKLDFLDKRLFIKEVFNSTLYYSDNSYRTPYLIDILKHNELILKEKGLLFIDQSFSKKPVFAQCSVNERSIEPYFSFFTLISKVNTA